MGGRGPQAHYLFPDQPAPLQQSVLPDPSQKALQQLSKVKKKKKIINALR